MVHGLISNETCLNPRRQTGNILSLTLRCLKEASLNLMTLTKLLNFRAKITFEACRLLFGIKFSPFLTGLKIHDTLQCCTRESQSNKAPWRTEVRVGQIHPSYMQYCCYHFHFKIKWRTCGLQMQSDSQSLSQFFSNSRSISIKDTHTS